MSETRDKNTRMCLSILLLIMCITWAIITKGASGIGWFIFGLILIWSGD